MPWVANKVLKLRGGYPRPGRVDFRTEAANGLVLCPSDIDETGFMVDREGKLWSIDFGRTCFLPPSFVTYSLKEPQSYFARCVAYLIKWPDSPNFEGMYNAAGQFVIYGGDDLCMRLSLITFHWMALTTDPIGVSAIRSSPRK